MLSGNSRDGIETYLWTDNIVMLALDSKINDTGWGLYFIQIEN